MTVSWKEAFAKNAKEALSKLDMASVRTASEFIKELNNAGVTVKAEGDQLKVAGKLTDEQRARLKAMKPNLLSALKGDSVEPPNKSTWKASDLAIEVSLSSSGITDFILGPAVEGKGINLPEELEQVLLDSAAPVWADKVRSMGGLRVYSLSQWAEVKPKLQEAIG